MDIPDVTSAPSGLVLLLARRRAGVTQQDVAEAMGVTRPRVAYLEGRYHLPDKAMARYLDALAQAAQRGRVAA